MLQCAPVPPPPAPIRKRAVPSRANVFPTLLQRPRLHTCELGQFARFLNSVQAMCTLAACVAIE